MTLNCWPNILCYTTPMLRRYYRCWTCSSFFSQNTRVKEKEYENSSLICRLLEAHWPVFFLVFCFVFVWHFDWSLSSAVGWMHGGLLEPCACSRGGRASCAVCHQKKLSKSLIDHHKLKVSCTTCVCLATVQTFHSPNVCLAIKTFHSTTNYNFSSNQLDQY